MISLFRRNRNQEAAEEAYQRVVAQARRPEFFSECGVPDTIDGRFELICLHAFLYLYRSKGEPPPATELGQLFFDAMFADFDRSLREMGTGDLSVGRQVKRMAEAFYGRIKAYEVGLAGDEAILRAAVARNLYRGALISATAIDAMAGYLRREAARRQTTSAEELLAGRIVFGAPPIASSAPSSTASSTGPTAVVIGSR